MAHKKKGLAKYMMEKSELSTLSPAPQTPTSSRPDVLLKTSRDSTKSFKITQPIRQIPSSSINTSRSTANGLTSSCTDLNVTFQPAPLPHKNANTADSYGSFNSFGNSAKARRQSSSSDSEDLPQGPFSEDSQTAQYSSLTIPINSARFRTGFAINNDSRQPVLSNTPLPEFLQADHQPGVLPSQSCRQMAYIMTPGKIVSQLLPADQRTIQTLQLSPPPAIKKEPLWYTSPPDPRPIQLSNRPDLIIEPVHAATASSTPANSRSSSRQSSLNTNEEREDLPGSDQIQIDSPEEVSRLVNMSLKQFKEIRNTLNKNHSLLIGYLRSMKKNKKILPDIKDLFNFPFNLNDVVSMDPVAYQGLPNKDTFTSAQREMIRVLRNRFHAKTSRKRKLTKREELVEVRISRENEFESLSREKQQKMRENQYFQLVLEQLGEIIETDED